jgi:hypothetical protein
MLVELDCDGLDSRSRYRGDSWVLWNLSPAFLLRKNFLDYGRR